MQNACAQVQCGASVQQRVGNAYAASLYMGLAGLIEGQVKLIRRQAGRKWIGQVITKCCTVENREYCAVSSFKLSAAAAA